MPIYNRKTFEIAIISEMDKLCHPDLPNPMSLNAASIHVSSLNMGALFTFSKRTCVRLYSQWQDLHMLPCDVPRKLNSTITSSWTVAALSQLKSIIDSNPTLYLDEIRSMLKKSTNKTFSLSSICRAIKVRLKYSRKVVYVKASQQIQREKDEYIATLKQYLTIPEMAIFVDESNKDRKAARRKYGYGKVGSQVNYRGLFNMDVQYTFIGAADCFGFVIPACDFVLHTDKEKEGEKPVDAERFVEYVRTKLVPILGNFLRKEPHSVVIIDNCSIHLDERVRERIEAAAAIIVFSAPYAPELIPIEYMFSQWKYFLKRNSVEFNCCWYPVHLSALLSVTRKQGLHYFKNTTLNHLVRNHPLLLEDDEEDKILVICILLYAYILKLCNYII
jgi:hypothetical protein